MIAVVNIKTHTGPYTYIGRAMPGRPASPLGNPFKPVNPNHEGDRALAINNYRRWLWHQMQDENSEAMKELRRLAEMAKARDLELACWCKPLSCHGDVVKAAIEWLNRQGGNGGQMEAD